MIEKEKTPGFSELQDYSPSYINVDDITIVVPTLNEEQAIGHVLEDLQVNSYENIMVVDGGSVDKTVDIAEGYKVRIINQEGSVGKAGAVKTAVKHVDTPYLLLLDGDCTYSAEDIEKLLPYVVDYAEVIGARILGRENISPFNRFGNRVINLCFNIIFGTRLKDVCSGMYVLSKEFAEKVPFETRGFDVEVEIAAHAANKGMIKEVPISYHSRLGTQKLHPIRDGFQIMSRILHMGAKLCPVRMLYISAILLLFPGIILMGLNWQLSLQNAEIMKSLLGVILITLAIQGFTLYIVDNKFKRASFGSK